MFYFTSVLITPVLSGAMIDDDFVIEAGAGARDRTRLAPLRKARPPRGIGGDGASGRSSTCLLPVPRGAYQPNRWRGLSEIYRIFLTDGVGQDGRLRSCGLGVPDAALFRAELHPVGQGGWARTSDLRGPDPARYQPALHPDEMVCVRGFEPLPRPSEGRTLPD